MIDADGYRPNVGIIIANTAGRVLWARRVGGGDAWQFPQGGVDDNEDVEHALYRELHEEVGLTSDDVRILARTKGWLRYRLPRHMRRGGARQEASASTSSGSKGRSGGRRSRSRRGRGGGQVAFKGQKQKWFLLQLTGEERNIRFDCGKKAEFDGYTWVSYWYPVNQVIDFKRDVYRRALLQLATHLPHAAANSGTTD
ncbi:MAG: RNA pyrophosphohydrolase [Pseudomonadota bacterium]